MKLEEQKISQKTLYEGKVITVWLCDAKLPNGHISLREVVHHSGGAAVLFVKDNKILLERQFRFPSKRVIWKIPAGKLNKGRAPLNAAKRGLKEETGFRAENLRTSSISIRRPAIPTRSSTYTLQTAQTWLAATSTRTSS